MAPWEEIRYFDIPVYQIITILAGQRFSITADPMRIYLAFSNPSSVPLTVQAEDTSPGSGINKGFFLRNDVPPVIIRQRDDGVLAQSTWFVRNDSAIDTIMNVLSVRLKEWPPDSDRRKTS